MLLFVHLGFVRGFVLRCFKCYKQIFVFIHCIKWRFRFGDLRHRETDHWLTMVQTRGKKLNIHQFIYLRDVAIAIKQKCFINVFVWHSVQSRFASG